MALTLQLTPELQARLDQAAKEQNLPAEEYTLRLLEDHLPPADRRAIAIAVLQSWLDESEAEEQRETGEYLIRVLDEDRPADAPLYPKELKGITW
jgi:predicted transcriptional regulator